MMLNMHFSPASCCFIPLRSKYSHQHLQCIFFSSCEREICTHTKLQAKLRFCVF
jgi:hypothetical protein